MERNSGSGTRPAGAGDRPDARGIDAPAERRPGVPMEAPPRVAGGADPAGPQQQRSGEPHLRRAGLTELTPVYGTGQPPRGLSGVMRRAAYRIPEHSAGHWAMLLAADRVDILEDRLTHGPGPDTLNAAARRIRTNPLPVLILAALAGAAVRRTLR